MHNAVGQVVQAWEYNTGGSALTAISFQYDVAGNLARTVKLTPGGSEIAKTVTTYTYDRLGRQLSATDTDVGLVQYLQQPR